MVDPPPDGDPVPVRVGSHLRRDPRPARVRITRDRRRYHRRADEPLQRPVPELRRFAAPVGSKTRSTTCPVPRVFRSRQDSSRHSRALMAVTNVFGWVLLAFGSALAFVVVFTTFTANVTERTREIATMRTIGEDNVRLTVMVTLENLLLTLAALPLGVWLGVQATNAIFASFTTVVVHADGIDLPREHRAHLPADGARSSCSPRFLRCAASSASISPRRPRSWSSGNPPWRGCGGLPPRPTAGPEPVPAERVAQRGQHLPGVARRLVSSRRGTAASPR